MDQFDTSEPESDTSEPEFDTSEASHRFERGLSARVLRVRLPVRVERLRLLVGDISEQRVRPSHGKASDWRPMR
jgi:hypothetical protein